MIYYDRRTNEIIIHWDADRGIADILREAAIQIEEHVTRVTEIEVDLNVNGRNYVTIHVGEWDEEVV